MLGPNSIYFFISGPAPLILRKKFFFVMFFADMQAKEKVDGENKMRREEEELLAMEKINSNLNDKIGSLLQEIRTLREGLHGILR